MDGGNGSLMALLNSALGETEDSSTADTTTLVPGTGKQLKQGLRGLQQKKFKIGVKRGLMKPRVKRMGLGKAARLK